jgi:hypothetical protein
MNEQPLFPSNVLERVREGMTVVDSPGHQLGRVIRLRMGDPDAASVEGNEPTSVLGGSWATDLDGLEDLPDELRRDLRRAGFLEVDGPDLEGAARLIPGDRIAEVSGDTVYLHPLTGGAAC